MLTGFLNLKCSIVQKILHIKLISPYLNRIYSEKMSTLAGDNDTTNPKQVPGLLVVLENNPKRLKRVKFLGKLFKADGYELRIAGGAVRDILRGTEPQDIDFATTAKPEQSLKILKKHEDILRIIVTASGQKHGTVAVKFKETEIDFKKIKLDYNSNDENNIEMQRGPTIKPEYDEESPFEITTLRCDCFTDGRHAEVEFINDWRKDAERRDLTINAMFLTLDEGKLIDYFNGEADLKNGIVRFVGDADQRIKEDYLRILRYFRFWSRYNRNDQLDSETITTIQSNLSGLNRISGERLWQEIKKTLSHFACYKVVNLMLKLKLFEHVGLIDKGLEDYDEYVNYVLEEIIRVQKNVITYSESILNQKLRQDPDSPAVKKTKELLPVILFASIIRNLNMCMNAHERMKFSNIERDSIRCIIDNRTKNPTLQEIKYQLAMVHTPERSQMLHRMRALLIYKGRFDCLSELESWQVPTFSITGHALSQEVKKRKLPGDKIKIILQSLKNAWATSDYTLSKEDLEQKMSIELDELKKTLAKIE